MKPGHCILALDLGTSAFKCAGVNGDRLVAEPVVLPYELVYSDGRVTFPALDYIDLAIEALGIAANRAAGSGFIIDQIGICSQAQTFVPCDIFGAPEWSDAIVWTDCFAAIEADEVKRAIADYPRRSGFAKPSPQQFLPKAMHLFRQPHADRFGRLLLLNEFIIMHLTGVEYGDTTIQGMGGFYDISSHLWNEDALKLAGIHNEYLAASLPAGGIARPLLPDKASEIGIPEAPVFSCGNDQCCSAIGAGLSGPGGVVCNFGTAMVAYTVCDEQPLKLQENQIAGIDPLTGGWFLLAYESHCGDLLDWSHRTLYADAEFEQMLEEAVNCKATDLPRIHVSESGKIDLDNLSIGHRREHIVHALLIELAERFELLIESLGPERTQGRSIAAGGLSRSPSWLRFLESRHDFTYERAPHEHASLLGIARIIQRNANRH